MNNNQIAPHEILELHELMNFNIVDSKKMTLALPLIKDNTLKTTVQNTLNSKKARLQELQNFINNQIGTQSNNAQPQQ